MLLSEQILTVIKHVVNDNIICLSATQLMHASVHGARNSSTVVAQNSQFHFSWAVAPIARAELSWLQDLGSLQQRGYELHFNKIEEIKHRLVELWKNSNTKYEWKDAIFVFPRFAR